MHIAKIIGKIISTEKIPAYRERKLLLAQKLDLYGKPTGLPTMAIDYVGAGDGDIVILGAAPGLASTVFNIP
ncbi:MAG TPA: EutN/CcmL family microcompartment protein, partial [Candidatus Sumerlaeota bacterium]|nr:EutN/CcmL family microcompartment protein [Candidatus Sumerlaeota bacterium]